MREFHGAKAHFLSRIGGAKRIGFGRQIRDVRIAWRVLRHIDRDPLLIRKLGQRLPGSLRPPVLVFHGPEGLHVKDKTATKKADKSYAEAEKIFQIVKLPGLAPHPVSPFAFVTLMTYWAAYPPSTVNTEPVIHDDSSEARNNPMDATSSGVPTRPSG